MRVIVDLEKKSLKVIENERSIFKGEVGADKITLLINKVLTNEYPTITAKLSNGRLIGPYSADGTTGFGNETIDSVTYTTADFTLSKANGFTLSEGKMQVTIWMNSANGKKEAIGNLLLNVTDAVAYDGGNIIIEDDVAGTIVNIRQEVNNAVTQVNLNGVKVNELDVRKADLSYVNEKISDLKNVYQTKKIPIFVAGPLSNATMTDDNGQTFYSTVEKALEKTNDFLAQHASNFTKIQSGNIIAKKAQCDAEGNVIKDTYATKTYVNQKINDLFGEGQVDATLDTIAEISKALKENINVAEALDNAIATKADKTEVPTKLSDLKIDMQISGSATEITYAELKALRDNGQLVAGNTYIITDYEFTTTTPNTKSAGHQFDIIVTADSENTLSEIARARLHKGDTYFAKNDLSAWELKYCLDNDIHRFDWADEINGKGVIYWMKDEWNNEVPYDFKNIIYEKRKGFWYQQWGSDYFFVRNESLDTTYEGKQFYAYETQETPSAWSSNICYIRYSDVNELFYGVTMYDTNFNEMSYGGQITEIVREDADFYTFNSEDENNADSMHGKTHNIKIFSKTQALYDEVHNGEPVQFLNNIYFTKHSFNVVLDECSNMVFGAVSYSNFAKCFNCNFVYNKNIYISISNSNIYDCSSLSIKSPSQYDADFNYFISKCDFNVFSNTKITAFENVKIYNSTDLKFTYSGPTGKLSLNLSFKDCEFDSCYMLEIAKSTTVSEIVDTVENCVFKNMTGIGLSTGLSRELSSGEIFWAFPVDSNGNTYNRRYFEYNDNNLMCVARSSNGNFYGLIYDGENWNPISN